MSKSVLALWGETDRQRGVRPWIDAALAALLTAILGSLILSIWQTDTIFVNSYYNDYFIPWTAGAGWSAGFKSSVDFPSALGPLYFLLQGLGYVAADGQADAVPKANVLALLFTLPIMAFILVPRFPVHMAALIALFFALYMVSARCEDCGYKGFAYLASYNRQCFVWMSLIMIAMAIPRHTSYLHRGHWVADSLAVSLLLMFCIYTKVTFAVFVAPFIAALLLFRYWNDVRALLMAGLWIGAPVLLSFAVVEVFFSSLFSAYVADLMYVGSGQKAGFLSHRMTISYGIARELYLFEIVCATLFVAIIIKRLGWTKALPVLAISISGAGLLFLSTAQTHNAFIPVFSIATILLFGLSYTMSGSAAGKPVADLTRSAFGQALAVPPLLLIITLETANITWQDNALGAAKQDGTLIGFSERKLFFAGDNPLSVKATMVYRDATTLIDVAGAPKNRVLCLGFSNPCPSILGEAPPKGPMPWWDPGRSFPKENPPAPDVTFGDVETLLIARGELPRFGRELFALYRPHIEAHFTKVAQSDHWVLWRPKQAGVQTGPEGRTAPSVFGTEGA